MRGEVPVMTPREGSDDVPFDPTSIDWESLLLDSGRDPDAIRDVWALTLEYAPDNDELRRRIQGEIDWKLLMRDAGNDPDAVAKVGKLAAECAPGNEGLRRRLLAQWTAARKTAARLAGKAQAEEGPRKKTSAAAGRAAAPPAAAPAESGSDGDDDAAASGYDPAEEEYNFVRDVTSTVLDRDGTELTREQALAALAVWREHVAVDGQPLHYVYSPGRTAVTLGNWLCARYRGLTGPVPLAEDSPVWELAESNLMMRVLNWTLPELTPSVGDLLVEYDVSAQYLAAMSSVRLGDGEPSVLDAAALAEWEQTELVKHPGYLVLASVPDLSGLPAHAAAAFARLEIGSVLPTPLATYLVRDHKVALDLDRAVVWYRKVVRKGKEVLPCGPRVERMAEEIRVNRSRLQDLAAAGNTAAGHALMLLKDVYARFSSGFLRSKDYCPAEWRRPDWSDMIAATASANSLRRLDKAAAGGWHPIGQIADGVWFVVDADPADVPGLKPAGLELGTQPGKWHRNRWGAVTEAFVSAFRNGRGKKAGKELTAINDEREAGQ
ncbi:hypothetical protein [Amycolatopsis sp. NPDC004079]|uniref:hypothetical protein n=1 Tax=Amycolatopsis sp. NPDC004079 TaxID=3154549 RepID=UPI0033B8F000